MCGVAGSINYPLKSEVIKEFMGHRGPDGYGYINDNSVELHHLRLSIIDIDGGGQPMSLDDKYTIIFNGEIYNYKSLNETHNLKVSTNSDTETVLHMYRKYGIKCLDYFDGMFVIVIYDKVRKELFIARDRAGKKPLYYYKNGDQFVFCSELRCLNKLLDLKLNTKYFGTYLRLGTFYRSQTPFENVLELEGGHYLMIRTEKTAVSKYKWWSINTFYQSPSTEVSEEEHLFNVDQMLRSGVMRRTIATDLEVGSFLSGGIDSGLVTAIASEFTPTQLKTFTVAFEGSYNEGPLAKLVSDQYNTQHHQINISFDNLKNDVESILTNYGEPFFDSSAIPSYYVSQAAKNYVTVVLNGDGADELFGGYKRYVPFSKFNLFETNKLIQLISRIAKKSMLLPNNKKSSYNNIYRLINLLCYTGINQYLCSTTDIFEGYNNVLNEDYGLKSIESDLNDILNTDMTGLQKIMCMDFNTILFSDLLVKMDIATMANSIEGRSPLLCKELLEYVPTINDRYKIKGKTTKCLLRKLASRYLPQQLIHQPKRGFEIPLKKWVNGQLHDLIRSYLTNQNNLYSEFLDEKWVYKLLENKIRIPDEQRAKILWTLFSMELWYRRSIRSNKF